MCCLSTKQTDLLLASKPRIGARDHFSTRFATPWVSRCSQRSMAITQVFGRGRCLYRDEHSLLRCQPDVSRFLADNSQPAGLSSRLLEFFVHKGSVGLTGCAPMKDPFVQLVLQLSQSDELILSAVLAISACQMHNPIPEGMVDSTTLFYYSKTLGKLSDALHSWPEASDEETIRILAASILLCEYEVSRESLVPEF